MKNFIKEHTSFSIVSFLVVAVGAAIALRDYVPVYTMVESGVVASGIFAASLVIYAIIQTVTAEQE
jgi:hypothetical protein